MQDNASIHTAGLVDLWLKDHFIPTLPDRPLYSPVLRTAKR